MSTHFLNYWTPDNAVRQLELADTDPLLDHAASAQFTRLRPVTCSGS